MSDKPKISMAEMLKNKQQSLAKNKFKSEEANWGPAKVKLV